MQSLVETYPKSQMCEVHTPVDPRRTGSWMGVRSHIDKAQTTVPTKNPNMMRYKAKSTTIEVAPIQQLPADISTGNYQGTYQNI